MESNKQPVASATTTGRRTTWVALGFFVTVVAVVATVMLASVSGFLGDAQVGTSIRRRLGEIASSAELKLAFKVNEVYGKKKKYKCFSLSTRPHFFPIHIRP